MKPLLTYDRVKDPVLGLLPSASDIAVHFTSDTHFGHKLPRLHAARGVADRDEMDELLIRNWNSVAGKRDVVYHLGDLALCGTSRLKEILDRLNGRIVLLKGNHDHRSTVKLMESRAAVAPRLHDIEVDGRQVVLCHYPILSWERARYESWHLHGHLHKTVFPVQLQLLMMDVGVDQNDLTPVSWERVCEHIEAKKSARERAQIAATYGLPV
jgi:calcineurin-like phosphoesterase family protein